MLLRGYCNSLLKAFFMNKEKVYIIKFIRDYYSFKEGVNINRVGDDIIVLNDDQLKAIMDFKNNIYLSGRPGTGKSEAILYRIMNIINKRLCSEKEILIIVSKNINEVRLRNKLGNLGLKHNNINICTIKDFCLSLVREMSDSYLGLKSTFTYINKREEREIILEILNNEYGELIKEKVQKSYKIRDAIDKVKLDYIFNKEYINTNFYMEFLEKYNEYLDKNDLLDYMDILRYSEKLLKNNDIRDIYSKKYKYINIHKVCEMSIYEYKVISKIFNNNIMMVSDKLDGDNEIYQLFKEKFKHNVIEFNTNHRVTKNLVNIENEFVNSMWENQGYLEAGSSEVGEKPSLINTNNIKSEAEFLVNDILENKLKEKELSYGILVKDSLYGAQLKIYLDKYSKGSLIFSLREDINFLSNKTIEAMISYLNLIIDKHSDYHLKKVVREFYPSGLENIKNIENNKIGLNLTDLIDGSTIKYKDPFGRLFRYMNAETAAIVNVERERLINNEVVVKLSAIKIDGYGSVIDEICKEIYIGESSSLNEAVVNGKEFLNFVSGNLLIGNNMIGTLDYIDRLNEFLGIGVLNHKSYYDIFEIIKRYYRFNSYELKYVVQALNLKNESESIYNIKNILIYLIENNINKDTDERVKLIEQNIEEFYTIKKELVSIRNVTKRRGVSPIDLLDKIIEVTGNKKIHLFDWDSGDEYREYLKDFFEYFDEENYNIIEKTRIILDKISIWKKYSGEFISKENTIPILTLKEGEGFHFNNVYICGVNEENYSLEDKMSFYTAITRGKKKLKFIRPIKNVYGDLKGESILIRGIRKNLDIYRY